jgi:hypothetical protein
MSTDVKPIISDYLTKMGVTSHYDDGKNQFKAMIKIKNNFTGADFECPIVVLVFGDWVIIEAAVADLKQAPTGIDLEKIYDGMLQANFMIPEVNYALYKSMIVSLAWSKISALSLENFKSEFEGVLSGVENFFIIVSYAKSFSIPPPKEFSPIYQ